MSTHVASRLDRGLQFNHPSPSFTATKECAEPGAISTVIIYADQAATWLDMTMLFLTVLWVAGSAWIALHLSDRIRAMLGTTGINIVTRLLGLIPAAVGVEFLADGLTQLLPGLAKQE